MSTSDEQLEDRVERLLGPMLDGMTELQLNKLDQALERRLQEVGGDHRLISDDEIVGHAELVQESFPRAFQVAGEYLRRRRESMN